MTSPTFAEAVGYSLTFGNRWHKDLGLLVICSKGDSSKPRDTF